jgi:hypothetical protein
MLTSPSKAADRRARARRRANGKNAHKSVSKNRAAIQPFFGYAFFTQTLWFGYRLLKIAS